MVWLSGTFSSGLLLGSTLGPYLGESTLNFMSSDSHLVAFRSEHSAMSAGGSYGDFDTIVDSRSQLTESVREGPTGMASTRELAPTHDAAAVHDTYGTWQRVRGQCDGSERRAYVERYARRGAGVVLRTCDGARIGLAPLARGSEIEEDLEDLDAVAQFVFDFDPYWAEERRRAQRLEEQLVALQRQREARVALVTVNLDCLYVRDCVAEMAARTRAPEEALALQAEAHALSEVVAQLRVAQQTAQRAASALGAWAARIRCCVLWRSRGGRMGLRPLLHTLLRVWVWCRLSRQQWVICLSYLLYRLRPFAARLPLLTPIGTERLAPLAPRLGGCEIGSTIRSTSSVMRLSSSIASGCCGTQRLFGLGAQI